LIDETLEFGLESFACVSVIFVPPKIHVPRGEDIQLVNLLVGPAAATVLLFLHPTLDLPDGTLELLREFLALLLFGLQNFLILILLTSVSPSCVYYIVLWRRIYTLMRLFSFCSSLHSVSNLCFMLTAFCISDLDWSFSFCSWSARFLDFA
jgi:hypothetical protein